ncbi:MAG: UvrD-helicase domain-containing protein, partial [Candidatus Enteromonas sp.]
MGFNKEQAMAISAGIDEDILISAGAGSGKTKTLSERVYRIISDPSIGLKPSELLVLTFTNNAAHEMKTRIVARFVAEGKDKEALAAEMQSAHIQTFDSFNGDLVRAYSDRLGLPDSFMVADESVLAVKENDVLESVLKKRYDNPEKREIMASLIERFSWKNDKPLRKWLLGIYHAVAKFVPNKKRSFYERYEEDFLTDEFLAFAYSDFIKEAKDLLSQILCKAHYEGEIARGIPSETLLGDAAFWEEDLHRYQYEDSAYAMPAHQAILALIDAPDEAFLNEAKAFGTTNKSLFPTRASRPGVPKEEKERLDAAWKEMKRAYGRKDSVINALALCPTLEETKQAWAKDRPLYALVLEILREFNDEMIKSKMATASFTFEDISSFALELLTAPEYEDVAEEVRERFRYIMVDEYQDTNDAQEVFLESLLKPNREGTRAHLFCVGDSKQSIYAFRNSNVELFKDRQKRYLDGNGHRVIAMNKNYRSGPGLLSDLNVVFEKYMRLSHGGVDYSDPMERLAYDQEVNLYSEPYKDFGIQEIFLENADYTSRQEVMMEAQAILLDIQKKVANGYLVYDRSSNPHVRPCRYSDFVILMRKKTNFGLYQRLFNRAGVKLNNLLSDNLREIDPITVLQSLFGLLCYFYGDRSIDAAHLFVSVARSYIGNYSDEEIYALLSVRDKAKVLERLATDPLWNKIASFASAHREGSFRTLFLDLLSDFGVI